MSTWATFNGPGGERAAALIASATFAAPAPGDQVVEIVTLDAVARDEIVGYLHEDRRRFMPVEVFEAWRKLSATPAEAAAFRPVSFSRAVPR